MILSHIPQVADISVLGITEAYRVKSQVLVSASEAAEMIIRVDDILKSAPRFVLPLLAYRHSSVL
jgi:chaperonin GroEL (HSP60 family)